EVAVEIDPGSEHAVMDVTARRRLVGEAHDRLPLAADHGLQQAKEHAHGELDPLADDLGAVDGRFDVHDRLSVDLFHTKRKRFVMQAEIPGERLKGMAYGRLLPHEQPDRTENR